QQRLAGTRTRYQAGLSIRGLPRSRREPGHRAQRKVTDSVTTGNGLDDIDFSADQKVLYAAASVTATLTIAEVSDDGKFHVKALIPTAREARGVIATKGKTAYLIDPAEGRILKLSHR